MIKSIKKRDGRIVLYNEDKIAQAILKAMQASGEGDASDAAGVANSVEASLEKFKEQRNSAPDTASRDAIDRDIAETEARLAREKETLEQYDKYSKFSPPRVYYLSFQSTECTICSQAHPKHLDLAPFPLVRYHQKCRSCKVFLDIIFNLNMNPQDYLAKLKSIQTSYFYIFFTNFPCN